MTHQEQPPVVTPDFRRVGPAPGNDRRRIPEEFRIPHLWIHAIVRHDHDETALGQRRADEPVVLTPPALPRPAVEEDDQRPQLTRAGRPVDIEPLALVGTVGDGGGPFNAMRHGDGVDELQRRAGSHHDDGEAGAADHGEQQLETHG